MLKRKFDQNHETSNDEMEFQKSATLFKKQNSSTIIINENMPSSSKKHDSSMGSDIAISPETSNTAAKETHFEDFASVMKAFSFEVESVDANSPETSNTAAKETHFEDFASVMKAFSFEVESDDANPPETSNTAAKETHFEDFASVMKAFSFEVESDDEDQKLGGPSQNDECKNLNRSESNSRTEVARPSSSSNENDLETHIRILSVPSKLSQVALLEHPASLTLHGYVQVSVWLGKACIFGYEVKEGENIKVFSTEGTGLKKVVSVKSVHESSITYLQTKLEALTIYEDDIDVEEFVNNIGPEAAVLMVEEILPPPSLKFLELYYPHALQTKWPSSGKVVKKKHFELCSTQESYTIDISSDFKILSEEVNQIMSQSGEENSGCRILVKGEKKLGKSTLIRYLINSALNKHRVFYFLDTDLNKTEYTPPGVVSLYQVTRPLLGPPFAHQKKALKMIFVGSLSPAASPKLFERSIICLMMYFNANFPKKTLFVNTMGWCKGVGELCLQYIIKAVKPTMVIKLVSPDLNLSFQKDISADEITYFTVPSKAPSRESGTPYYKAIELREFNLISYFGLIQKPYLPISLINSFRPFCVSWDKIAMYVMWKKVPHHRLISAIHFSIVALCNMDLSCILKSDNPKYPMTLSDEPICECLGFGLVSLSDETNRLFYVITPLTLDELKHVNALVKGDVMIPDQLIIKQNMLKGPLPFTEVSMPHIPGLKPVPKRAFQNVPTPLKKT